MLYNFGRIFGAPTSTLVKTDVVTVLDLENKGTVNITTDIGSFYLNGIEVGSVVDAVAGDTLEIELTTASGYVSTIFCTIYQDGVLASIFSATTTFDPASEFDPDYLEYEPYEVLPDSEWQPSNVAYFKRFGASQKHDLLVDPSNDYTLTRLVVCDYHRDSVYFCDPLLGLAYTEKNELTKPASSADYYDAEGFRVAHLVLYRGENKIAFFEDYLRKPENDVELADGNAIKIKTHNSSLYVLYDNNALYLYTISEDFSISEGVLVDNFVRDFILDEGNVAYLKGIITRVLVDFDGAYIDLVNTAEVLSYNSSLDVFAAGHTATGAISFVSGGLGNRAVTYDADTGLLYISYIETHGDHFYATGEFFGILKFDQNSKVFFQEEVPTYGIQDFTNYLMLTYLYTDIDPKVNVVDLKPSIFSFTPGLFPGAGGILYSDEITVGGLGAPTVLSIPNLTNPKVTLEVNGKEIQTTTSSIANGDTFRIKLIPQKEETSRLDLPVVVGSTQETFTILPVPGTILPRDTGFGPVVGESSQVKTTDVRSFPFLAESDTIFVSVDVGQVLVNNIPLGKSANVSANDLISFSHTIPDQPCTTNYQTVTYGDDLFKSVIAYQQRENSVTRLIELGAPGTNINDVWLKSPLGSKITTSESVVRTNSSVVLSIPNIYNASLIKNGESVGLSSKFSNGDKIQLELTTSNHYNTEHRITISGCDVAMVWRVYTTPDLYIDSFDLGSQEDLALTDYVISEEIVVSGLGYRQSADILVPYGTILFINGLQQGVDPDLLDYRGVLKEDLLVRNKATEGTRIRLEGYPRNTYGTTQLVPLQIGYTVGNWSLKTYNVDPLKGKLSQSTSLILERNPTITSYFADTMKVSLGADRAKIQRPRTLLKGKTSAAATTFSSEPSPVTPNSNFEPVMEKYPVVNSGSSYVLEGSPWHSFKSENFIPYIDTFTTTELYSSVTENASFGIFERKDLWFNLSFADDIAFDRSGIFELISGMHLSEFPAPVNFTQINAYSDPAHFEPEPWFDVVTFTLATADSLHVAPYYTYVIATSENSSLRTALNFLPRIPSIFTMDTVNFDSLVERTFVLPFVYQPSTFFSVENKPLDYNYFQHVVVPHVWQDHETDPTFIFNVKWFPELAEHFNDVFPSWIPAQSRDTFVFTSNYISEQSSYSVSKVGDFVYEQNHDSVIKQLDYIHVSESTHTVIPRGFSTAPSNQLYFFELDSAMDQKEINTLPLQQVFSSTVLAIADAESYGLTESDIHVIPYEDSYIWVHAMPCNNMCGGCPETGYIHGG